MSEEMPRNIVGENAIEKQEEVSDEELLASMLPDHPITFRWRYANREVQLYERHLRSLHLYGIGPALQSWMRSRLEWVVDNKLYEAPSGVIVIDVDPQGDVDIKLVPPTTAPVLTAANLIWANGELAGCSVVDGSVWVETADGVVHHPAGMKGAAETFARDIAFTLKFPLSEEPVTEPMLEGAQLMLVNDEFGAVVFEGCESPFTAKIKECFDKLFK